MRSLIPLHSMLLVAACGKAAPPTIDRVEMRRSGWVAEDVTVSSTGAGRYHISEPSPAGKISAFTTTQDQFAKFLASLEPYREKAERYTDESAMSYVKGICPPEVPHTTDAGAMYVRWIGPNYDMHYFMDFGCDAKRNAVRYKQMHDVLDRLPLPRH